MQIDIEYAYRQEDLSELRFAELAAFVLEQEECGDDVEVGITFVDNDEIARLNEEYRGIQGPTDVLSFECDGIDDEMDEFFDEDSDAVFELGDVIIAPDVAQKQTAQFGTTLQQEIGLLIVHGLLHLCGYDHIEEEEAQVMEAREDELLRVWLESIGQAAPVDTSLVHGEHGAVAE